MTFCRHHWTTLIDAIRKGAIQRLSLTSVDFRTIDDYAFMDAVDCRGLQPLTVWRSEIFKGFITDDLIRSSVSKGLPELCFYSHIGDAPHSPSEDALLHFFFAADTDAAPGQHPYRLELDGTAVTDMFASKFFEVSTFGGVTFYFIFLVSMKSQIFLMQIGKI